MFKTTLRHLFTSALARNHGISRKSVQTILHKNKFHPYKVRNHKELSEDDYDRRLEFCEIVTGTILMQNNFTQSYGREAR